MTNNACKNRGIGGLDCNLVTNPECTEGIFVMLKLSDIQALDKFQEFLALEYKEPIPKLWREKVERLPDNVNEVDAWKILSEVYVQYYVGEIEEIHELSKQPTNSRFPSGKISAIRKIIECVLNITKRT
ncbi:MAG: hypothetical protein KAS32_01575 [Candidatus Peribacteraceae bacterium]|nr:hypothetical protein [Candidatus Peribacteraceae bacterium]